jgi:hypothetical protein
MEAARRELTVYDGLHSRLEKQLAEWKQIASTDVPAIDQLMRKENVTMVEVPSGSEAERGWLRRSEI